MIFFAIGVATVNTRDGQLILLCHVTPHSAVSCDFYSFVFKVSSDVAVSCYHVTPHLIAISRDSRCVLRQLSVSPAHIFLDGTRPRDLGPDRTWIRSL